jgi:hypothetical protein
MAERLDHEDTMELAVRLTCSYLGSSHSGTTDASELILNYYRQIRRAEARLAVEGLLEVDEEDAAKTEVALAA